MQCDRGLSYSEIDRVSGKLIHMVPVDVECKRMRLEWASIIISNLAFDILIQGDVIKATNLITSVQGVGEYGPLRGRLFENRAHKIIMDGGEFLVRNLNDDSESEEQFPTRKLKRFSGVKEVKEEYYNVPNSKIFQTVFLIFFL